MNALEVALTLLAQAASYLDKPKPSLHDVGEALDRTGEALKALKHANGLLELGIYSVAQVPDPGTALPFDEEN